MKGHLAFSGSREGLDSAQLAQLLVELDLAKQSGFFALHHGDCIGADAQAHYHARALGFGVEIHPPEKEHLRAWSLGADVVHLKAPYLERNRQIVDACAKLLAFPFYSSTRSSGTWQTINYALARGKPVLIVPRQP